MAIHTEHRNFPIPLPADDDPEEKQTVSLPPALFEICATLVGNVGVDEKMQRALPAVAEDEPVWDQGPELVREEVLVDVDSDGDDDEADEQDTEDVSDEQDGEEA